MKKLLVFMLVAVMVFSLAACGGDSGKKSDAVFKVGATGPLTGEAAIYGVAVKYGAEIAVEEVNALGGVQFEFRMEDDTHDTEKADNAYNALKDWGMDFMMGSVTSSPAEVTAANAFKDRCFYLTPSASSPNVVEGKDNIFQMCFTDPNQGSSAAQFIKDNFPGKKMAVIWKNDDSYSTVIRDKFVSESKALGLEVVEDQTFTDATSTDFSVQIAKCQEAGAE
ncbi:MAG: ABC transporter substrate-binding protein, partial [Clostridiales bacterium]|nr:ABC transporter substrate-binding protein [Clostridiales bacterium]